jgi:hypothetical protein
MRITRCVVAALAAVFALAFMAPPAAARLVIDIDKSAQRMTVLLDDETIHSWPVSTGIRAYDTPSGSYQPFRMAVEHYSREWDDAPMPHSIFFTKRGHAIHGTTHVRSIGRPASHGCVRLDPANARVLFGLVKKLGMANTKVVLHGEVPAVSPPAVARRSPADPDDEPPAAMPRRLERPLYDERRYYDRRYGSRDQYGRRGLWVQRRDGSMVFIERAPEYLPPPYFFGRRGWY